MEKLIYDTIVVGGGHAAIEAACASTHKGHDTLMMVLDLNSIGYLACNPSIGGTSKGNLVKEIDAMGGMMSRLADDTLIQLRMLNSSKGVAVQSLRAQIDKYAYHAHAKHMLERMDHLTLRQAEAVAILTEQGAVTGVVTARKQTYFAKRVIVCTGVYLRSHIIVGDCLTHTGPSGFQSANELSDSLAALGHTLRRFKTGTPPRIDAKTVDHTKFEVQHGEHVEPFSWASEAVAYDRAPCYLGYTTEQTHRVIRDNLHRSAMYGGLISGTGARYCPSIEDKIVRFSDKPRHQFFLEPEGVDTDEVYVQGISTSMPADVQTEILQSIPGLDNVHIMRDAYAIEYDCIDSTSLKPSLESKFVAGLYFAGQINGTSGYEEAAAQGLMAGLNAALTLEDRPPVILTRDSSYIGVLIDDLVTKGTNEPYRMMTSRAEHRLKLRQNNSDLRLTPIGRDAGLVSDAQYEMFCQKRQAVETARARLNVTVSPSELAPLLAAADEPYSGQPMTVADVFKRNGVTPALAATLNCLKDCRIDGIEQALYDCRYEGYLIRENRAIAEAKRLESVEIPGDFDYDCVTSIRIEARQKLAKIRPRNIGQASRISGVNPSDITVLLLYVKKEQS